MVAIHEAGHAVVARACGGTIHSVSWQRDNNPAADWVKHWLPGRMLDSLGIETAACLGGYVATKRAFPRDQKRNRDGARADFDSIRRYNLSRRSYVTYGDESAPWLPFLRTFFKLSINLVNENWAPLLSLAAAIQAMADSDDVVLLGGPDVLKLLEPVRVLEPHEIPETPQRRTVR